MFEKRALTEREREIAQELHFHTVGSPEPDYVGAKADKRLMGYQSEAWFNSELEKEGFKHYPAGGKLGYIWRTKLGERPVRYSAEFIGDFFIDFFGNIEVKSTDNPNQCNVNIRRWRQEPTLYLAAVLREGDLFSLLGWKYGFEVFECEFVGDLLRSRSFYVVREFRAPEVFKAKLIDVANLHKRLNR